MVEFQSIRPGINNPSATQAHGNVCFCGCKNQTTAAPRFGNAGNDSFTPSKGLNTPAALLAALESPAQALQDLEVTPPVGPMSAAQLQDALGKLQQQTVLYSRRIAPTLDRATETAISAPGISSETVGQWRDETQNHQFQGIQALTELGQAQAALAEALKPLTPKS